MANSSRDVFVQSNSESLKQTNSHTHTYAHTYGHLCSLHLLKLWRMVSPVRRVSTVALLISLKSLVSLDLSMCSIQLFYLEIEGQERGRF